MNQYYKKDDGFFLACEDFFGESSDSFPTCHFFFFNWRSAQTHKFHFLGQDQSTVTQRAETTVAECFLISGNYKNTVLA